MNEPFNRDPDVPVKKIKARKYDYSPRPSISSPRQSIQSPIGDPRPICHSPTPYSKPSVGNLRDKFTGGTSYTNSSLKKHAPKPPNSNEGYHEHVPMRKGPAPQRPGSPYLAPKTDPIREMESIGKNQV